jgi:hypothetical protein
MLIHTNVGNIRNPTMRMAKPPTTINITDPAKDDNVKIILTIIPNLSDVYDAISVESEITAMQGA